MDRQAYTGVVHVKLLNCMEFPFGLTLECDIDPLLLGSSSSAVDERFILQMPMRNKKKMQ